MNDFSIADPNTNREIINSLNNSFNSIKEMVSNYVPKKTKQNYAILAYKGNIEKGKSLYVDQSALFQTNVYAVYGSSMKYVGVLVDKCITFSETLKYSDSDTLYPAVIYQPYPIKATI